MLKFSSECFRKTKFLIEFCKQLKKQFINHILFTFFEINLSNYSFKKTLIIGLGLIGGSFAKAIRVNNISNEIYAFDVDPDSLEQAIKSNVINDFMMLEDDLSTFDLIVFATPIAFYDKIAKQIKGKISPNAVIIDLGSVKNLTIKKTFNTQFIPCHPIAGSEKTGFANSTENLFQNKKFIICQENCNKDSVHKIADLATKIGSQVEFLEAKKHDEIYALVSHLPQFLSFLTADFSPKNIHDESLQKAFRLDKSAPEMWSDIFKLNENNLEKFYLEFFDNLEENIKKLPAITTTQTSINISPETNLEALLKFDKIQLSAILFRALIAKSYLEIDDIEKYKNYAGSGFQDFTSIVSVLNCDQTQLSDLLQNNLKQIRQLFDKLTTN